MTKETIEKWLDKQIEIENMRKANEYLDFEDDWSISICGVMGYTQIWVPNNQQFYRLINILQATVSFKPWISNDGNFKKTIEASFNYKGHKFLTLLMQGKEK